MVRSPLSVISTASEACFCRVFALLRVSLCTRTIAISLALICHFDRRRSLFLPCVGFIACLTVHPNNYTPYPFLCHFDRRRSLFLPCVCFIACFTVHPNNCHGARHYLSFRPKCDEVTRSGEILSERHNHPFNPHKKNCLDFSTSLEMTMGVGYAAKHGLKTE